ncbi:hypothetical protein [Tessaracoccus sp.]
MRHKWPSATVVDTRRLKNAPRNGLHPFFNAGLSRAGDVSKIKARTHRLERRKRKAQASNPE